MKPGTRTPGRKKWWLTAFLISPVLVVALLLYLIDGSIRQGTELAAPPIGAGAGRTGMANEFMGARRPAQDPTADAEPADERGIVPDDAPDSTAGGTPAAAPDQPPAPPEAASPAPRLVRPETLPQGFVLVVEDITRQASDAEPIYLASSWNGWDPKDPQRQLERRSDGKWQIVLSPPEPDAASIAFKFTMGGWDREELGADAQPVANRLLAPVDASRLTPGERPVIALQVVRFRTPEEARAPRSEIEVPIDAVGTVVRLELIGGAGRAAGMVRNAQVWLPPGYDDAANAARRYPVLYMLDGQNLFQTPPGGFGEWQADETALRLIEQGTIEPLIIVGIPHAGLFRADEYLPFPWIPGAEPSGGAFEAWLLGHVMPRVERAFRVDTGPDRTGIGGSSLGGVMSLFIATRHPDRFGRLLAESVSTMGGPGAAFSRHIDATEAWPERVYLGMGGREGRDISPTSDAQYLEWASSIERRALATRSPPEVMLRIVPDHAHNEDAWAERLPGALEFLFPRR